MTDVAARARSCPAGNRPILPDSASEDYKMESLRRDEGIPRARTVSSFFHDLLTRGLIGRTQSPKAPELWTGVVQVTSGDLGNHLAPSTG